MLGKHTVVIFFNDWPITPHGSNCGGGETATIALAEAIARKGYRVIACANLPDGEVSLNGVEYWNFTEKYDIPSLLPRLSKLDAYIAISATLAHPFMFLQKEKNCISKILINHSPGINPSGIESRTVMHLVDKFVCVSEAQKNVILSRPNVSDAKIVVIKNGFDPNVFTYAGPENRDWQYLIYVGRVELPKGIHILLNCFATLKPQFPNLKLHVYGDTSYCKPLLKQINRLENALPGLKFCGKVSQEVIAQEMKRAGCLVFPSISFESAGLAIIEAQASGCPVVASAIGGVPEYLISECGVLVPNLDETKLECTLRDLLTNREKLIDMSKKCAHLADKRTWDVVADDILQIAEHRIAPSINDHDKQDLSTLVNRHTSLNRTLFWRDYSYEVLLNDHEIISAGCVIDNKTIENTIENNKSHYILHFWRGLLHDAMGMKELAKMDFETALKDAEPDEWQINYRLLILEMETNNIHIAKERAQRILNLHPNFPYASELKRLIERVSLIERATTL